VRQLGSKGEALIKEWEGLRLTAYLCQAGKPTIGWGHTGTVTRADVGKKTITQQEAQRLFEADVARFVYAVNQFTSPNTERLTQNQFDALVSLAFNIGVDGFKGSTAARLVREWKLAGVPAAIRMWNKVTDPVTKQLVVSQGLVNRRNAEVILWNDPDQGKVEAPSQAPAPSGGGLNERIKAQLDIIDKATAEVRRLLG
jgi:lysozyme